MHGTGHTTAFPKALRASRLCRAASLSTLREAPSTDSPKLRIESRGLSQACWGCPGTHDRIVGGGDVHDALHSASAALPDSLRMYRRTRTPVYGSLMP